VRGRVLVIAGSDSGGGAGIQADIKAIMALGAYATTAITALTAQDTLAVHGILPVPPDFVRLQAETALADLGADAIKTGMLGSAAIVETVAALLAERAAGVPLVVDPVMVAKGGARLLEEGAVSALKRSLLPLTSLLVPNLPEAEVLTGLSITNLDEMRRAAEALLTLGVPAVLLKGGHLTGPTVVDLLVTADDSVPLERPRIETRHTHGTGCTLASAVAAGLAQGMALGDAVLRARTYVQATIAQAPGFGSGQGPLNHAVAADSGTTRLA
jgi:hydroxymethylpyrimidine/phosphomethylpyrimidine kinase